MNRDVPITVLYRGSLKSCNYHCSYCPFSKHRGSKREWERDRQQWFRFVESVLRRPKISGVMVVPYGEALIHPWYWQGLGRLTAAESVAFAGGQTNGSFPAEECFGEFERAGGRGEKLRLWVTFHPEMSGIDEFVGQCRKILEKGASLCVGAVGVPGHKETVKKLRERLPKEIYLWVNKMDGLRRSYTEEEIGVFQDIDPFFSRELRVTAADKRRCTRRIFVDADGRMQRCNISGVSRENWYRQSWREMLEREPECDRKVCSCYLAYGGRNDVTNRILFGEYPLFRIPANFKAVFLDIDKTLIPEGEEEIPLSAQEDLKLLADLGKTKLFFATSLSWEEARRRCSRVWDFFSGGIFLSGAWVVFEEKKREKIISLAGTRWIADLKEKGREDHFRVLVHKIRGMVCKVTLLYPKHRSWSEEEAGQIKELIWADEESHLKPVRIFSEDSCLQITAKDACKAGGVRTLCDWMGISPKEAMAAGDSLEDQEMMLLCR